MATTTTTLHLTLIIDKMQISYNAFLLHISNKLDSNNLDNLRHYFHGLIPIHVTKTMDILRTLEYMGKISWDNIHLLKEAMHKIGRIDIAKELTEFEIKRDLALLLNFHVSKILELDLPYCSLSVKRVAGRLVRLQEVIREKVDITAIGFTVESSKDMQKALVDFEEEIDCTEPTFSWNEFAMLVIIAGEIIAAASEEQREEGREPVIDLELCFAAAEVLCCRMIELGSWDDFCANVRERYNLVYHRQNMESNPGLILQRKRREVMKQLRDAWHIL